MKYESVTLTHDEAVAHIDAQLAECRYMNFVIIENPWDELKPISRAVHKSGGGYWVRFNKCKCWITGAKKTTLGDYRPDYTFYIGY